MQHTLLHTPDDAVILTPEAPAAKPLTSPVAPAARLAARDRIVEIKALRGPEGELLLSLLHASGRHRLQPVRPLEVLIRQLAADGAATRPRQPGKSKVPSLSSTTTALAGAQNTD